MFPSLYDLYHAEEYQRQIRRDVIAWRLAQNQRISRAPAHTLFGRLRTLLERMHLARPVAGRAEATA
jgi:hypothetical protein